ncbi:hypothetical protein BH10ACT7_BH10ACT7_19440 [soil metagenome]
MRSTVVSPVSSADWSPVSLGTMRHILEQMKGPRELSDEVLLEAAKGFLVPRPNSVHFATQRREIGAVTLVLMTMSAMRVTGESTRTPGTMYITFVLGGTITIRPRDGQPQLMPPGSASAITDWRSYETESTDGTRCLQIMIPEERLEQRGIRVRAPRFKLEGSRSLRVPLRGFALAIADASWHASPVGEQVAERTIEDLVVGMFLEADGYAMDSEDLRAGLRGRALSDIAQSHRSPDLTPSVVADHLAVSLRHLQRAFEDSGSSIANAITRRRAESAALLLTAPGASTLTIEEVAKRAGFSSAFELRAAFRSHYGMLPSEFRGSTVHASSYVPEEG